jgi:hypothetical protein
MKVFIVFAGEFHEGGSIVSIHSTEEGAIKAAMESMNENRWMQWQPDGVNKWKAGCDYYEIQIHEVL